MTKQEEPLDDSISVVKTATCEKLTRKSRLTYQVDTLPDGEVYLRIHRNSGYGFFSLTNGSPRVTSRRPSLGYPPGFLLAALVEEKQLVPMQSKKRSH